MNEAKISASVFVCSVMFLALAIAIIFYKHDEDGDYPENLKP